MNADRHRDSQHQYRSRTALAPANAGRLLLTLILTLALSTGLPVGAHQDDGGRGPRETPTVEVIPPTEPPVEAPPPAEEPTATLPPAEPTIPAPSDPPTPTPTVELPSTLPSSEPSPSPSLAERPSPSPSPSVSPTSSPSPSPSPSPRTPNGSGTLIVSPGISATATAGDAVEFVHTITYIPLAGESGTVQVAVQGPAGWPITLSTRGDGPTLVDSNGDVMPDQVTLCADAGTTSCSTDLVVRLQVPTDAASNEAGSVVVSAKLVRESAPADQNARRTVARATSAQLITVTNQVTIQGKISLVITGGQRIAFGVVGPDGSTTSSGITASPTTGGYYYTAADAVTVKVTGNPGQWTVYCYVASSSEVMQTLAVSRDSATFIPVPSAAPGAPCLSGSGNTTATLDLRLTVTWDDAPGPVSGQLVFTVVEGRAA